MRRFILFMLVSLMVLSVLAGCRNNAQKPSTPDPGDTSGEKTEVQLWHYHTAAAEQNLVKIIEEYNALKEGKVTVVPQTLPRDELLQRLTLGVVSGELPELAIVDNPDAASFAAMGMYIDITDRMSTLVNPNFLEGPLNSGKYQDKQYSIPIRSNCLALWINDEMFEQAGIDKVPSTWDELLDASAKLRDKNPSVYPLAFSAVLNEQSTFQFYPFLYGAGGSWDSMDSEESIKALNLIKTLYDKKYVSPEIINWAQNDVQKQFASGNAAMMIGGSWNIANMNNDAPDLAYTIANIPAGEKFATTLGGENMGMTTAASGKEEDAWDFIKWFVSLETSIKYNQNDRTFSPNADATIDKIYPDDDIMAAFREQLTHGVARGPHPKWPEISSAIQEAIQSTLTGIKDLSKAAGDAAAKIKAVEESSK